MPYRILISRDEINARLPELALEIERELTTAPQVIVLALLNGALWFAADLLRHLPVKYQLETLRVSSYGHDTSSSGIVQAGGPYPECSEKTILVVDDVLDAGHTLNHVCATLRKLGAKDVYTVVAIDKQAGRKIDITPDFSAFSTNGKGFLVGYGMDYADQYRNLPFVAVLNEPQ